MAMTTCRECGGDVSDSAKTCPGCGIEDPAKSKHFMSIGLGLVGWVVIGVIVVAVVGRFSGGFSGGTCNVVSVKNSEDAFIINGELDHGVVTDVVVALDGGGRDVTVEVTLETNHGDIRKSRLVSIADDGQRAVQLQFPEPTITTVINRSVATCS